MDVDKEVESDGESSGEEGKSRMGSNGEFDNVFGSTPRRSTRASTRTPVKVPKKRQTPKGQLPGPQQDADTPTKARQGKKTAKDSSLPRTQNSRKRPAPRARARARPRTQPNETAPRKPDPTSVLLPIPQPDRAIPSQPVALPAAMPTGLENRMGPISRPGTLLYPSPYPGQWQQPHHVHQAHRPGYPQQYLTHQNHSQPDQLPPILVYLHQSQYHHSLGQTANHMGWAPRPRYHNQGVQLPIPHPQYSGPMDAYQGQSPSQVHPQYSGPMGAHQGHFPSQAATTYAPRPPHPHPAQAYRGPAATPTQPSYPFPDNNQEAGFRQGHPWGPSPGDNHQEGQL